VNTRRKLIIAIGAGVLTAPLAAFAQQKGKVWRLGFLSPRHVDFVDTDVFYGPFRQAMRELGYVDGRNLVIEWRSAEGEYERLPGLAAELVAVKVDVIVTMSTRAIGAAQKATTTIPIVMGASGNPVADGFIASLARPGGNITGQSSMAGDLNLKQLEMLLTMVSRLSHLTIMANSTNPSNVRSSKGLEAEAKKRGLKVLRVEVRTPQEIDHAFSLMRQQNTGALIVTGQAEPFFQQQIGQIAELTAKHRLPAMAGDRMFAEAGVLMSYGPSIAEQFRRAANYVDKIFKGAKPADLPVEQPTLFDLVINGKTAKALGLKIPQSLLISADKVIE
jgi:putative ABC transport system substrate-binding protein